MKTISMLLIASAILATGCATPVPLVQTIIEGEIIKDGVTNRFKVTQPKNTKFKSMDVDLLRGTARMEGYSSAADSAALEAAVEIGKQNAETANHAVDTLGALAERGLQSQGLGTKEAPKPASVPHVSSAKAK